MRDRCKNAQFLRHLIYDLKRDYGFPILIVKTLSVTVDIEEGTKRPTLSYRSLKRAIFLPARTFRSFVYDLTYVASNKNFTTGSFFDPTDRVIFLDARDIINFEMEIDDRIIYNDEEYIITEIHDFIEQTLYGVKMRHVAGQALKDPSNQSIQETITVIDSTTAVKS